jgi:hypothetical protein
MFRRSLALAFLCGALFWAASPAVRAAPAVLLDFEGLPDNTILTTQYPGVVFSNAVILTAGVSLNEFEFPPHSGTNVASDNNGPMSLNFTSAVTSFEAYFTYSSPITVVGFDGAHNAVAESTSLFSNNMALSGVAGSQPNEVLGLTFASGLSGITITGDPAGGSFVLDAMSYVSAVPEPTSAGLLAVGAGLLLPWVKRRNRCSQA